MTDSLSFLPALRVSGAASRDFALCKLFSEGLTKSSEKMAANHEPHKTLVSDTVARDKLAPLENILLRGKTGRLCRS